MAFKTYELLPNMDAAAPVYQTTPGGQREQVKKIPFHRPTLRQTFQNENGRSVTIRYKATCESILQSEQIEKEKIPANEPFSSSEYTDLQFRYGTLTTDNVTAQEYLEAHPEFLGFKGKRPAEIREARYKLVDAVAEAKTKNKDMRKRVGAANKVLALDLEEAQEMLIRLNGSFFETPTELEDCQNLLMEFIDDAEEAGLDAVLKNEENTTVDEQTTVLIGKLLNQGTLSFDAVEGKISKKDKDGKWVTVRDMSATYSPDERKRLFSDFLNSQDGKALKDDLIRDLPADSQEEARRLPGRPKKIQ